MKFVPTSSAWMSSASKRFAPSKLALWRFAPNRSARRRSAPEKFASRSSALAKSGRTPDPQSQGPRGKVRITDVRPADAHLLLYGLTDDAREVLACAMRTLPTHAERQRYKQELERRRLLRQQRAAHHVHPK